jgi:hypothetical protein
MALNGIGQRMVKRRSIERAVKPDRSLNSIRRVKAVFLEPPDMLLLG